MSLVRVLKTTMITLTHTFAVDNVATDAAGAVTVTIKRLDGSAVASGTATHGTTGVYTWPLAASPTLDIWTVDWAGTVAGAAVTIRDYVEVVGDFLFGLDEVYSATGLNLSPTTYPPALVAAKRIDVEQECERICRQAFVPRFFRETVSGTGTPRLVLKHMLPRVLRSVTVAGVAWAAPDVAAVGLAEHGVLTLAGGVAWPLGLNNITLEYEHGRDMPPQPVREAGMLRLRSLLPRPRSGVPDRASSFTAADGSTYRLALPGVESTGIPDVDGAYQAFARRRRAVVA